VGISAERVVRALQDTRGAIEPAPSRDVRDRIAITDDEFAAGEVIVQHLIVPLRLASVAIHGVVEPLGRGELEVHGLPGERPET
jgi:hypothetical protein